LWAIRLLRTLPVMKPSEKVVSRRRSATPPRVAVMVLLATSTAMSASSTASWTPLRSPPADGPLPTTRLFTNRRVTGAEPPLVPTSNPLPTWMAPGAKLPRTSLANTSSSRLPRLALAKMPAAAESPTEVTRLNRMLPHTSGPAAFTSMAGSAGPSPRLSSSFSAISNVTTPPRFRPDTPMLAVYDGLTVRRRIRRTAKWQAGASLQSKRTSPSVRVSPSIVTAKSLEPGGVSIWMDRVAANAGLKPAAARRVTLLNRNRFSSIGPLVTISTSATPTAFTQAVRVVLQGAGPGQVAAEADAGATRTARARKASWSLRMKRSPGG
jgi:hypothetical protein